MRRLIILLILLNLPLSAQDFSAHAARQLRSPRQIRLHNQPVLLQSAHVWNDGETVTWNGIVDNPLPGTFSLAISGNVVEGFLSTASGELFSIGGLPDQLTYTAVPTQPFLCPTAPAPAEAPPPGPRQLDSDNQIDILVAYSAATRARAGSVIAITNTIRGAVDYTNQAFVNSGIATQLNLVGVSEVPISESGSCLFDLNQITILGNTSGNEFYTLRQQTGADLVSLFITDGNCAGIGWLLLNQVGSPNAAYSVTALNTSTNSLTFAHEIGHNLGANHDRANGGPTPGLFPYSYGYQNTSAEPFFRDLMAYECVGTPCPRQPYFANPNIRVFGRPTGVAAPAANSADLAATFALSAPVVANYRPRNPNPDPSLVPAFTATPKSINVPRSGGTYTITIKATAPWTAKSGDSWLLNGVVSGLGDAEIVVRIPAHNAIGDRFGQILFSPGDNPNSTFAQSNFSQVGVQAAFSPSGVIAASGAFSGQTRLTLSDESFAWTATNSSPGQNWFTFSPLSGTGSTTFTYSAAANPTTPFRNAGLSIGNAGFGIQQSNSIISPLAAAVTLPAAGGSASLTVFRNPDTSQWMATAFSTGQWLTATPNQSSQSQSVATYTATRNPSSADRFATLTIGSQVIPVRQLGQRCALSTPISLGVIVNAELASSPACGSSYLANPQRAAYTNRYTFVGTAGQTVRILMESAALDSVLYLTGPNNELLTQDDNSGGGNNAAIPNLTSFFVLPSTGTYTIEATSFSLGAFTLRLLGSTPATATLLPAALTVSPIAGTGTLALSIPSGLAWSATAASSDEWLQVTTPAGTGNATLAYSYFPNPSTTARTATIRAAGQTFTLTQSAAPPEVRPPFTFGPPLLTGPDTRDTGPLYSLGADSRHVFRFTHPGGFSSLGVVNVLINTALDGGRACYIAYSQPAGVLYLVDDAGPDVGLSALTLGSSATVSNSQCTIHAADSSAVGSGNQLTLTLRIEFKPAFSGYRVVYLAARDSSGGNSGWTTHGGIAIPDLPSTFPRSGPIQPASGLMIQPFIRFSFQHEGSINNLGTAWVLMGSAVDARNACYVAYFAPGKLLLLLPDDGDASKATSMPIPSNGSLQNSQCTIFGQMTSLVSGPGELAFSLNILFNAAFQHKQIGIWTATQTLATPGNPAKTSPWSIVGSWYPTRVGF